MLYAEDGDGLELYGGDCFAPENAAWLDADVLVTDPPYGIAWQGTSYKVRNVREAIQGDADSGARDAVLAAWGDRPAVVFGSPMRPPPEGTRTVLAWQKPGDSGLLGAIAGYRRDWEAVYLIGAGWRAMPAERSGVIKAGGSTMNNYLSGHPHAKPVDLMAYLIRYAPPGVIADPFAGSGSTLLGARIEHRRAIGVEISPAYCALAARRLGQPVLW